MVRGYCDPNSYPWDGVHVSSTVKRTATRIVKPIVGDKTWQRLRRLGGAPQPQPPAVSSRSQAPPPSPPPSGATVDASTARAWFERRRPTYVHLAKSVQPYVPVDGVVFDVGGNIGFFTEVLAETVGFRGTVHLFEPLRNLADLCTENLSGKAYTPIVHAYGLGAQDESTEIFVAADGNLGWNTLIADKTQPEMTTTPIAIRAFDGTGIKDVPDFVKIDVEGAEYLVLRGLLPALQTWETLPVILCEIGWGESHPAWDEELAVFDELAKLGYSAQDLDGGPIEVAAIRKTTDVLLVPGDPAAQTAE
ncbi:FkbM family methyltransferase [Mumia xiangluensis]|uniref:FkbM family methyltransferase n=1 Tax=Mumia xiangluensis TaxID=1678900 RepID=A0ABW1QQW8_9ACTN